MDLSPKKGIQRNKPTFRAEGLLVLVKGMDLLPLDTEEETEKKRVDLADDPSNRAMVQRNLHDLPLDMRLEILSRLPIASLTHFRPLPMPAMI
ncbi:hypothetical protein SLA2020_244420 [Shorea laevis]